MNYDVCMSFDLCNDVLKFTGTNRKWMSRETSLTSFLSNSVRNWSDESQVEAESLGLEVLVPTEAGPIPLGFNQNRAYEKLLKLARAESLLQTIDTREIQQVLIERVEPRAIAAWQKCMTSNVTGLRPLWEFSTDKSIVIRLKFNDDSNLEKILVITKVVTIFSNGDVEESEKNEPRPDAAGACIAYLEEGDEELLILQFIRTQTTPEQLAERLGLAKCEVSYETLVKDVSGVYRRDTRGSFKREFFVESKPVTMRCIVQLRNMNLDVVGARSVTLTHDGLRTIEGEMVGGFEYTNSSGPADQSGELWRRAVLLDRTSLLQIPYRIGAYIGGPDGPVWSSGNITITYDMIDQGPINIPLVGARGERNSWYGGGVDAVVTKYPMKDNLSWKGIIVP